MNRRHPRAQLRWSVGQLTALQLLGLLLGLEIVFAEALSLLFMLASSGPNSTGQVNHFFAAFSAVLGAGSLTAENDNPAQQVVAATASVFGALTPAIIVGIAIIRIFTVQPIQWRSKINLLTVADLRHDLPKLGNRFPDDARILQVRFYRSFAKRLKITDLCATAQLRYSIESGTDGSTFFRTRALSVLDASGEPAKERRWSLMASSMPFTLFIPVDTTDAAGSAAVGRPPPVSEPVRKVQGMPAGENLTLADIAVSVSLQGKIVDLNLELNTEHRYALTRDLQRGRAVSVDPPPGYRQRRDDERRWVGWRRFDDVQEYGVFVPRQDTARAASVANALALPVSLTGYALAVDGSGKPYLIAEKSGLAEGHLVVVDASDLHAMDEMSDHAEARLNVTKHVVVRGRQKLPDVIWTYTRQRKPTE